MRFCYKSDDMLPQQVAPGLQRRIVHTQHLMMANIEFTDGPTSAPDPYHSHPHEQVSYVVEGEILFFAGDDEGVKLKAGDHYAIPSGVPHTIQRLTQRVRIIDCFTPLRDDFLERKPDGETD
jgi:quercetin dioxygenase-like cupin family protein